MTKEYRLLCKKILLAPLKRLRKCASLINEISGIRWPETTMAIASIATSIATIVLAIATYQYVILTHRISNKQIKQTNQQQAQFEMINRAKVWFYGLSGDVKEGNLSFMNAGNLQAKDCKFLYEIIKVEGAKVIKILPEQKEVKEIDALDQDEIFRLSYSSDFNMDEQVIFLIVLWKYTGEGIKGYRFRDEVFLWNTDQEPSAAWVRTSVLGADHIKAINEEKNQIKTVLSKK